MKKYIFPLLLSATVIGLSACSKNDSSPSNNATVMFVNGSAGTTTVDVKANAKSVNGATGLAFQNNSGYQNVTAGSGVTVTYYLSSTGTQLATQSENFTANTHYTVFAGGVITGPAIFMTTDDLSAPSSGNAKIRLVNLSPDALSLTGGTQTITFASNVTSESASTFAEIPAGSYDIKVGDLSQGVGSVISTGTQQLNTGKIYTVIYTGTSTAAAGSTSQYSLKVINN